MLGQSCEYRKNEHHIIHPRFERWMKRQIPKRKLRERLFVYFHRGTYSFVIALWDSRRKKRFRDIINLGYSLFNFDREEALNFILNMKDTITPLEFAKRVRDGSVREYDELIDNLMQSREERLHRQSTKQSLLFTRNKL